MSERMSRWTAVETIGRGVEAAPALKTGFVATLAELYRQLDSLGPAGNEAVAIAVRDELRRNAHGDFRHHGDRVAGPAGQA